MKKPANLSPNDKISVIAPSFGAATEPYITRYFASIKNFKRAGYEIIPGPNVNLAEGVAASNTPIERAKEFMDAYLSDSKAIISVGGGELMCEMLSYVDFNLIKKAKPKMFMGFSDNSNLVFTLTTICDIQTIYGPDFPSFHEHPWRLNQADAIRMLKGETHFEGYPKWRGPRKRKITDLPEKPVNPLARTRYMTPKRIVAHNYENEFTGRLIGGCLDCIVNLCGTRFDKVSSYVEKYKEDGIIWFLEACDYNPLDIRRALFQLKEAGWFKYLKGFLIGRHLCHDLEMFGVNKYNAVIDVLDEFNVPILLDIDLGHFPPSMPIKSGGLARVSLIDGNIIMDYLD